MYPFTFINVATVFLVCQVFIVYFCIKWDYLYIKRLQIDKKQSSISLVNPNRPLVLLPMLLKQVDNSVDLSIMNYYISEKRLTILKKSSRLCHPCYWGLLSFAVLAQITLQLDLFLPLQNFAIGDCYCL